MAALLNLCRFVPTTGGTTDWVYASTVGGCQSPALAGAVDGRKYKFLAISGDLAQWEIAEGAYTAASGTFARTSVLYNSSGSGAAAGQSGAGTKINFSAAPNVAVVGIKEDLISIEEANSFTAMQKARARANIDVLKKNYIINGGMMVSQENGVNAVTTSGSFPVDMWAINTSAPTTAAFSAAQVASASPAGSPNRLRLTVTAAQATVGSTLIWFQQSVEGLRTADLLWGTAAAKNVTLQVGIKASVAGTYLVQLINSVQDTVAQGFVTIAGGETNTDVIKTLNFTALTTGTWLTNNGIGFSLRFFLMLNGQTANVFATNGNVFEIFDVGIYERDAAPAFQLPDYDDELRKCQRYYFQTAANEYLPVSGTLLSGGATGRFSSMPVPVPMRTDPAVTLGTSASMQSGGSTAALTAITATATPHATLMLAFTWTGSAGSSVSDALVVYAGSTPTKFNARL